MIVKGFAAPETGQVYGRARQLWEELGSPAEFLHVPRGQALYHDMRGEIDMALRLDAALLLLSRQRNNSAGLVLGHLCAGQTQMYAGSSRFPFASRGSVSALRSPFPSLSGLSGRTISPRERTGAFGNCPFLSRLSAAGIGARQRSHSRSPGLAHLPSLAANLAPAPDCSSICGDNAALSEWTDELVALTNEQRFALWAHWDDFSRVGQGRTRRCRGGNSASTQTARRLIAPPGRSFIRPIMSRSSPQHVKSRGKLKRP